ncbi:MAG: SDR family NAD(P)-dependent oxidoreductase [Gammaproteobacteria bacterium]|jgi:NAD(P)-dependent dehydrogenase (short-subunit alcohol dehydrogenase family)/acyl dehydratase
MVKLALCYTHRFCLQDQLAFAQLSGDYNPIHVDCQVARRLLYGGLVVHGLHLVLWSLDKVIAQWPEAARLEHLRACFRRPLALDQEVTVKLEQSNNNEIKGQIIAGDQTLTEIIFSVGKLHPRLPVDLGVFDVRHATARNLAALENDEGYLPLRIQPDLLYSVFPSLAQIFDHGVAAVLLATTRLVGMICPGLNSLFSGLELTFSAGEPDSCQHLLRYTVTRLDRRFNMIDIEIEGWNFHGKLNAFVRPSPANQLAMEQAAMLVKGCPFREQRALVVGGSRGLGEVTAKLLSAGGAHVTLTYSTGQKDAESIVAEIKAHGGTASSTRFNVLTDSAAALKGPFTHIYYFASPRIVPGRRAPFDVALFKTYCTFFVEGLAALISKVAGPVTIFYPSSIFLDTPEKGFVEYAAAKAAGEALCRYLERERRGLSVRIVRLPRMRTDQTQSIFALTAIDLAEPADVMRSLLLEDIRPNNL